MNEKQLIKKVENEIREVIKLHHLRDRKELAAAIGHVMDKYCERARPEVVVGIDDGLMWAEVRYRVVVKEEKPTFPCDECGYPCSSADEYMECKKCGHYNLPF